jgi:hypothetical protein
VSSPGASLIAARRDASKLRQVGIHVKGRFVLITAEAVTAKLRSSQRGARMSESQNPWDIPLRPLRGDINENMLFAEIGRALTEWEQVEAACAEIFAVLVSVSRASTHQAPAIRAYGVVASHKTRCEMLKAAAAAYFLRRKAKRAAFEKRFNSLINECSKFAARRNEIAHGQVSMVFYSRRGKTKRIGHYLLPSFYNSKKYKIERSATYEYTSREIIHFRQEFTKLHLRLYAFRDGLVGKAS